jgi:hypothetical protein
VKPISRGCVEQTWNKHCELHEDQSRDLMKRFTEEQPFLTIYLLVGDEELEEAGEQSSFIPLAALIWDCLLAQKGTLRQVDDKVIDRAERTNIGFLKKMEAESEMRQNEATHGLLAGYNQQALLFFVIEVLMSGHEEAPELAPENIGMQLLRLKTVIDCLDQSD